VDCSILGSDDTNAFPVDILLSKTVGHLKDAIKKKKENALNHIDADQLKIWKVGDPARSVRGTADMSQLKNPLPTELFLLAAPMLTNVKAGELRADKSARKRKLAA